MTETNDCDTDMDKTFIDATGFLEGGVVCSLVLLGKVFLEKVEEGE